MDILFKDNKLNLEIKIPNFGDLIRILRRIKGITQIQLAQIVGVTQPAIYQYEKGYRTPTDEIRKKILDCLREETISDPYAGD